MFRSFGAMISGAGTSKATKLELCRTILLSDVIVVFSLYGVLPRTL
jgi:hypothetical protein